MFVFVVVRAGTYFWLLWLLHHGRTAMCG